MRKAVTFLVVLCLIFVTACSSNSGNSNGGSNAPSNSSNSPAPSNNTPEAPAAPSFPTKDLEFIAPASPGGGWDATARAMQKIMKDENIVAENINVVNKPGGGGEVGWQYLKQQDAHHIAIDSSLLITNPLLGLSDLTFEDLTPLAILTSEWISVAVPNDSEIQTGEDLMNKLKEDPTSMKLGLAPGFGNNDHLSFVQAAKTYGVDVTKLQFLIYESGGDVMTSLLGGHVDAATMAVSESKEQHVAGNFRIIAVSSDERIEGLEDVPTWQEQGVDMVFPHWRGLVGPPNMTEEEIAYWDEKIGEMVNTDSWQTLVKNNEWSSYYKNSSETLEFMKNQRDMYSDLIEQSGLN